MPRLLLVDDNPSIHRIAESLLAPTDVELVCAGSAAEALDRLARGERFDVALVDTAMPGMDGWTLVGRLRADEHTAAMPIALMAGVLDPVDPARLAAAPVQGFLKKPIELRELGDRVKTLLATPVPPPAKPSPFSTVPATPSRELLQRAEAALPEYRPEAPEPPAVALEEVAALEADDLLVLTTDDLWPEEAPAASGPAGEPEVQLELEELDLESLQLGGNDLPDLAPLPTAEPAPAAAVAEEALGPLPDLDDLDLAVVAEELPADEAITASGPEVSTLVDEVMGGFEPLPTPGAFSMEPPAEPEPPAPAMPEPSVSAMPEPPAPVFLEPIAPVAVEGQAAAATGHVPSPVPAPANPGDARAVVQALLADPVLVDALVKAVVARMGDQVIREVAWEVMPELAEKLRP